MSDRVVHIFSKPEKPKSFLDMSCDRVSEKVYFLANKIGGFCTGLVIGAAVIKPLTSAIVLLADTANLLPKFTFDGCLNKQDFISALIFGNSVALNEELIFRSDIQDVFLTRAPKLIAKAMCPGKESIFDTRAAKVTQTVITSLLFSAFHWSNINLDPREAVIRQMFFTFFLGVGCGLLKESKKTEISGAIGAHMGFNTMACLAIRC